MKIQHYSLLLLALGPIALVSCGDDDDDNPPVTTSPQVEQPNSTTPLWTRITSVREVAVSPSPTPGEEACDSPHRFVLQNDGTFSAGPCQSGDQAVEGALAPDEQTELNRRANLAIESGTTGEPVCTPASITEEDQLRMTQTNNTTYTPFELDTTNGQCTVGDATKATSLHDFVLQLETKYFPTVQPSPSPSPTVSPSPSPTVSPSPTASPSPSPTVSPSPSPTVSPSPSPTVSPSPTPTITLTPVPLPTLRR